MAFGDNGPRKKTPFQKLTMTVVIVMISGTIGGILFTALAGGTGM